MHKIAVIGLKGLPSAGGAASVGESLVFNLLPLSKYIFTIYLMKSKTNVKILPSSKVVNYVVINDVFLTGFGKVISPVYYYTYSAIHSLFYSNYDLVHIHHRDSGFVLPFLAIKYKIMVTLHGTRLTDKWVKYSKVFYILDRLVVKYSSIVTSVSEINYSKIYSGKNKPYHIPNGVEDYYKYKSTSESKYKKPIICFSAGRILETKGLHILLESVTENNIDCEIWVIGNIDFNSKYGIKIRNLSKKTNCCFFGMIYDKETLLKTIAQSTIFVYPSYIEAMSMMLLEVASLGIPIICSDIGENKNIFSCDEVLFFESESIANLSRKIKLALQSPHLMHNRCLMARRKVKESHNWNNIAKIYSNAYQKLLQNTEKLYNV
jgi:glycosyltransferase involved in cell wall biosynthesis